VYTLQQFGRGTRIEILKNSITGFGLQENFANAQFDQPSTSESFYSQPRAYYTQEELNSLRITPQKICELLEMRNKARR